MDPADVLRRDNPLGKIPTLVTDDGSAVFDSRVILEYLDHVAGGDRLIPAKWPARLEAITMQALCDGVMDASILIVYEARHRPAELHHQPWLEYQRGKIVRGLTAFAKQPADPPASMSAPSPRPACSAISTRASRSTGGRSFRSSSMARRLPRQASRVRRHRSHPVRTRRPA